MSKVIKAVESDFEKSIFFKINEPLKIKFDQRITLIFY